MAAPVTHPLLSERSSLLSKQLMAPPCSKLQPKLGSEQNKMLKQQTGSPEPIIGRHNSRVQVLELTVQLKAQKSKSGSLLAPEVGLPDGVSFALAGILLLSQQAGPQPL